MKRFVTSGLCVGLFAMSLAAVGCEGGGGLNEGMPADVKSLPEPAKLDAKMGPPPKKAPAPGKVGARTAVRSAARHA